MALGPNVHGRGAWDRTTLLVGDEEVLEAEAWAAGGVNVQGGWARSVSRKELHSGELPWRRWCSWTERD